MRAILFDCFGVFARVQDRAGTVAIADAGGIDPAGREAFWAASWQVRHRYDRGDWNYRAYWREVGRLCGCAFDEARLVALRDADLDSWSRVDEAMLAYLAEVDRTRDRGELALGLLSNIPVELAQRYRQAPWLRHFDVVAFSCDIGYAKPEPESFGYASDRLGVAPGDIVFVDDTAGNVAAAMAYGMRGHRFVRLAQLREALAELTGGPIG